jgi:putative restriction endonuclease
MNSFDFDWLARQAAFGFVEKLAQEHGGVVPWKSLTHEFSFQGVHISLIGQKGIWKPKGLELPISVTTSPSDPYGDEAGDDGLLRYRYEGTDPLKNTNRGLRSLMKQGRPLLYFRGVESGWYTPLWPLVIVEDHPDELTFFMACEDVDSLRPGIPSDIADAARRKYVTRLAVVRLHQAGFRKRVLTAYRNQCSICHLKHTELLDAAHIISDKAENGDPVIPNGLSLCKIHHAAFDTNILGVTPDYKIEIREDVLEEVDGPMLRYGLQATHGTKLILPNREAEKPDRKRLEKRYEEFLAAS